MSKLLSSLIKKEIKSAFGDELYDDQLNVMADALASAIQQYLKSNVTVFPGQATAGGPTAQATISPGILDPK